MKATQAEQRQFIRFCYNDTGDNESLDYANFRRAPAIGMNEIEQEPVSDISDEAEIDVVANKNDVVEPTNQKRNETSSEKKNDNSSNQMSNINPNKKKKSRIITESIY